MATYSVGEITFEPRLLEELKAALDAGLASGDLMASSQITQQLDLFRQRFGPAVLRDLDGEALLRRMHERQDSETRCLMYWLEFKDDEEFYGHRFGGIGGGTALKFGIYQRQNDGAWIAGSSQEQRELSLSNSIEFVRGQRNELLAGADVLGSMDLDALSDEAYSRLQAAMDKAAPTLSRAAWAHKYWFLTNSDKIDDFHSPRYQRFYLYKLLQTPPDQVGILDAAAPRFNCAGRFITAARRFEVHVSTLTTVLGRRNGFHRYWRIGTTIGDTGESQWPVMRDGGFVSVGWHEQVPDRSGVIGQEKAKNQIRDWLSPSYPSDPGIATRKAGEILNLAQEMAERDLVLACDGQTVLGVGRVAGPYEYDLNLAFPHKRPVEWLLLDQWQTPEREGLLTTVTELGRKAANLLELEQRLFRGDTIPPPKKEAPQAKAAAPLPALEPTIARIDAVLRRKGQAILYGPPGTGKTHWALRAANELAARHAFKKTFDGLTDAESHAVTGNDGLVRVCTFHPGYNYEDFVEGLRPKTVNGQLTFERRDGLFKQLCADANMQQTKHFFLVVDEINRGDPPRIFGELITAIELDKRGKPIMLPVSGVPFSTPSNVFLIGTMNTADRSISLLDAALRRRFGFIELMPDSAQLAGRQVGGLLLGAWLDALNKRLRGKLKRDARNLQIGHAYLMPPQRITSVAELARVLRDDIIPLLEEYCYDDFGTLRDILGSALVDVEEARIREDIFGANREEELIQALSFEEMQPLVINQEPVDSASASEPAEPSADDAEVEDGPNPASQ